MSTFEAMMERARELPTEELRRHAAVAVLEGQKGSTHDDGTRCRECFCCAAEAVLARREGMFYVARKRGALGVATACVRAKDFDEFTVKHPDLEMLGVYENEAQARRHFTSDAMWQLTNVYRQKH